MVSVHQASVTGPQSTSLKSFFTRQQSCSSGTSQPGTGQLIHIQPDTSQQSPINQAMNCPEINHRSTGNQMPRHRVNSHRLSDTKYRLLGTSHRSPNHWLLYGYHAMDTSHRATRHQSSGTKTNYRAPVI